MTLNDPNSAAPVTQSAGQRVRPQPFSIWSLVDEGINFISSIYSLIIVTKYEEISLNYRVSTSEPGSEALGEE